MAQAAYRIAVVGGGFTGAAFIIHAARSLSGPITFEVMDPAADLGRGVAYGTRDPLHRINVPSDRMSLYPQDGDHATRWFFDKGVLPGDGSSADGTGRHYVPRWDYGSYVGDSLARSIREAAGGVRLNHHRGRAVSVVEAEDRWAVRLANGAVVEADMVVLSFGHSAPWAPFPISAAAAAHDGFAANPWHPAGIAAMDPDVPVLLVGTGLTMADMVETLLVRGHRGPITAMSRHGLLPQPHGQFRSDVDFLDGEPLPGTALALLRLARRRADEAERDGTGWQVAADALRFALARLWPALPDEERRRVARRLLPFWEVHRFRIAPQPDATLQRAIASGQVSVEKAAVVSLDADGPSLAASFKAPGRPPETRSFGGVVLGVGPDRDLTRNPLVRGLFQSGVARPDPLGMGLDVDRDSRLVSRDGAPTMTALALGPMTRGTFGEMTGAPDIAKHVAAIVARMATRSLPRR